MGSMPRSVWYDEGRLARKLGKGIEECPYKKYSYGHSQWMLGYTDNEFTYID